MTDRGKIDAAIMRLAFPAILSNITVPLLGLSDTFITGHLGSERYVAAIAVGGMMVNSLYWVFGFLRAGTSGLTAEAFGAGDDEGRRRVFTASFLLAILIGLALMILSVPLRGLMLWLMDAPPATSLLASDYFKISVLAAPALLATMAVTGWMIGSQNTVRPMIVAISVNVINIALSFTLVYAAGMGFYGVALGTLCANWAGLFLALLLALGLAPGRRLFSPLRGLLKRMDMRRFFRVNSDLMLRSLCIMAVTFGMTAFGGRMGDLTLAANAVVMQLFLFFSYFSDGFAYAAEAICGRQAGAGEWDEMRITLRHLFVWCGFLALAFMAFYLFATPWIAGALTDRVRIVASVADLRWVAAMVPPLSVVAFMLDGVYIGLTATRRMLLATFSGMALFFIAAAASGQLLPSSAPESRNLWLWGGFLTFLLMRGLLLTVMLPAAMSRHPLNLK